MEKDKIDDGHIININRCGFLKQKYGLSFVGISDFLDHWSSDSHWLIFWLSYFSIDRLIGWLIG